MVMMIIPDLNINIYIYITKSCQILLIVFLKQNYIIGCTWTYRLIVINHSIATFNTPYKVMPASF